MLRKRVEIDRTLVPLSDGTENDPGNPFFIDRYKDKLPMRSDQQLASHNDKWERRYDTIDILVSWRAVLAGRLTQIQGELSSSIRRQK